MVRVRFAPSPTGYLHVGGLRTALYNYLYARREGGSFLLRIEDTDRTRYVEGAVENLIETLRWAGLEYDEGPLKGGDKGPYVQSERLDIYRQHADELLAKGHAYRCYCTAERLEEMRNRQSEAGQPTMYDRHCLGLENPDVSQPHVVRMKIPTNEVVGFQDIVRDHVEYHTSTIDDQVLMKSDGYPTYHLANVVDDHHMGITHVIRGEEWLTSTPKHILLYRYFGWTAPQFAHLPLLLDENKRKLKKREDDVAVESYRKKGFLPEALVNFVALLGWSSGTDEEVFSMDELIQRFSLDRVGKSGAVFDVQKLRWMNAQHLRRKASSELARMVVPYLQAEGLPVPPQETIERVVPLMLERINTVEELVSTGRYLWTDPVEYDADAVSKRWKDGARDLIIELRARLAAASDWTAPAVESEVRALAESKGVKAAAIIHALRLALSGVPGGPGLFELAEFLGQETSVRRLDTALSKLP